VFDSDSVVQESKTWLLFIALAAKVANSTGTNRSYIAPTAGHQIIGPGRPAMITSTCTGMPK
ncbi:hypothetical protein IH799_06940, partial [candidate division KSB1 bacterium]|nr:hypothetical protein [candidate division KSB1 bacterium]